MARVIDFQGSVGSRFAVEEQMLSAISEWNDIEFLETASRLREFIRRRMLPEAAGQWITKESVLIQFGASDERSIFPCPPAIRAVANRLSREASKKVASAMIRGSQRICFHGSAGLERRQRCRKSTPCCQRDLKWSFLIAMGPDHIWMLANCDIVQRMPSCNWPTNWPSDSGYLHCCRQILGASTLEHSSEDWSFPRRRSGAFIRRPCWSSR